MKIFVYGSAHEGDDTAFRLAQDLEKVLPYKFVRSMDPTDLMNEDEVVIMDAVEGIDNVTVFFSPDIISEKKVSLHDFDIGYFLKLSEQLGERIKVRVLGIPMQGDYNKIKQDVIASLQELKDYVDPPAGRH